MPSASTGAVISSHARHAAFEVADRDLEHAECRAGP